MDPAEEPEPAVPAVPAVPPAPMEPAAAIAQLRGIMTSLEDLDTTWIPMHYMGNVNDPAFRAEHGHMFGYISENVDFERARIIDQDDRERTNFRAALQFSNTLFAGIPDYFDDGYSGDETESGIDPDESPTERFNRRQIQRAIRNSLRPEFEPEFSDPACRSDVDAMQVKTLTEGETKPDCVICMEPMKAGDEHMDFPCKHVMHAGCSRRWFESARTCPTCKLVLFAAAA
jgi:Ring finger domain